MRKILVIEDEEAVRSVILEMLGAEGFNVTGAPNGTIGVKLARQEKPDLILCDVSMPEMDGYDVLSTLRADPLTAVIPFIFLTGRAGTGPLREGMNNGADDYIAKPFRQAGLLKAINSRLARQSYNERQSKQEMQDLRLNIAQMLPHEFLTPIHAISLASEIMLKHKDSMEVGQVQELAERIHSTAGRLQRLIQNFLTYAELEVIASDPDKVKELRNQLTCKPLDIITKAAQERAKVAGREFDLDLRLSNTPVRIGENRLKKLVEELADNAFKYSLEGTTVRLNSLNIGDSYIFYVLDNGRGILPEQAEKMGAYVQFERRIYEQQGSGLGFIIAKRLTELHGGKIAIDSIPGRQTLMKVTLPAKPKLSN